MTYLRKLETNEPQQPGDIWCPVGLGYWIRPIRIQDGVQIGETIELPEPPAHRVEDETWSCWDDTRILTDYLGNREIVCQQPPEIDMGWKRWPIRKKRIAAGQEGLKLLSVVFGGPYAAQGRDLRAEYLKILAMLKD